MKNIRSIFVIILAAWLFQACSGNAKKNNADTTADQPNAHTSVSEEDSKFAIEAAERGMNEVELSYFAKDRLTNGKLKALADKIINDYAASNAKLVEITKPKNIILPVSLSSDGQDAKDDLGSKTAKEFDKAYAEKIAKDNKKTVKLFENAVDDVMDPDIKAFAEKTLPALKKHLAEIDAIKDNME